MKKAIVVYCSWSGNTESLAKEFTLPIERIERKIPYSDDYQMVAYTESKKKAEEDLRPAIADLPYD